MYRSSAKRLSAFIVSAAAGIFLGPAVALFAAPEESEPKAAATSYTIEVRHSIKNVTSRPLRVVGKPPIPGATRIDIPIKEGPTAHRAPVPLKPDPVLQTQSPNVMPPPIVDFEGVGDVNFVQPPDTTMGVGPNHIVQWVNLSFQVFDKTGTSLGGPFAGNSLWTDLGGDCANINSGDIIVIYDQLADRWFLSQPAFADFGADGNHQCMAVSTSGDPLGTYNLYDYLYSLTDANDYPKFGLWPDAYYLTARNFGATFSMTVTAFDRQAMLNGQPLTAIFVNLNNSNFDGLLPAYLDGPTTPPAAAPNILMGVGNPASDGSPNAVIHIYQFHPDFITPGNSTFTGPVDVTVADFNFVPQFSSVPQPPPGGGLEANGWVQYRMPYRNYGTHESVLLEHDVYDATGRIVPRWYEVRDPYGTPTVYQQGTFAPADGVWRWMGSIAMDANNNIAIGYSVSDSSSTFPGIRYAGRLTTDPLGEFLQGEAELIPGVGSFNGFRWGDYSTMNIDPVDDCTFWYTQEYVGQPGFADWQTRVGSFKFPSCTTGPRGTVTGTVTDGVNPLPGATVTADGSSAVTDASGSYTLLLPVGTYDMTASRFCYTSDSATGVAVTDGGTTIQNFVLAPNCGILEGTVTDGTNPIEGATVTAGAFSTTTNVAGHYQFIDLPAGTYDMTASKFGYSPDSASGVVVTSGGVTVQDFVLVPAQSFLVNGVVTDGSGQGWPLYALINITAPGYGGASTYTDPVTGYYSITLVGGVTYNFEISAPGYVTQNVAVPVGLPLANGGVIVQNFDLLVDQVACVAPGYSGGPVFSAFETGTLPPGWSLQTNSGGPWQFYLGGDPCGQFGGNLTGGTGGYAIVNSNCDGIVTDDEELRTPSRDLSTASSAIISWNNDFFDNGAGSVADVDISTDGGTSWTNVWQRAGVDERGPGTQSVDITGVAAGFSNVQARFHFQGFWAWWWQIDNVLFGDPGAECLPLPGGHVVGNVRDGNTGVGLNGATVTNLPDGGTTTTFATPNDLNQDDGLYILFAESGDQLFEASKDLYISQQQNIVVIPNSTVRLDFSLPAGLLSAAPTTLTEKVLPGDTAQQILTISNSGSGEGSFEIIEINAPLPTGPLGPFATEVQRKQAIQRIAGSKSQIKNFSAKSTQGFPAFPPKNAPKAPSGIGDVVSSFPSNLGIGWGVGFTATTSQNVWISNPSYIGGGDDMVHSFTTGGTDTGNSIDISSTGGLWVGDLAYNGDTGMLWGVNVGGDNCLAEMDPVTLTVTGNEICGSWTSISQRGVAYDGDTNTYYVGGWNEGIVYHINGSGTVLDSAFLGLSISGLAFNSESNHLLVMENKPAGNDITVLDAANNYNVVNAFQVLNNGSPAFADFQQAGLEFDCLGNLWAINQASQVVYQVESEPGACGGDIPWLSEEPTTGTVPPGGSVPVTVTFDSAGLFPGLRQAQLLFQTDTPTLVPSVGVNFTVRFLDVPLDEPPGTNPYENFIYAAAGANIMHGCSFFNFCPSALVTRADMAGYIWRSVHGAFTPPPAYTGIFSDVFFGDFNADYIQGVWNDGITAGCQAPGDPLQYCPNQSIPRGQMAVFIEKGVRGSSFVPPACTSIFDDVACPPIPSDPYGDWVELLFNDGITVGCSTTPPLFCPLQPIPNEQMAVFIVKAFGFPVLP